MTPWSLQNYRGHTFDPNQRNPGKISGTFTCSVCGVIVEIRHNSDIFAGTFFRGHECIDYVIRQVMNS
jgi:hypothetical protein